MKSSLINEDIELIFRILLKNEPEIIYDQLDDDIPENLHTNHKTFVFLTYNPKFTFVHKSIDYAILFGRGKRKEGFFSESFYFRLRENGSLLWFFPKKIRYPTYLNFDKTTGKTRTWKILFHLICMRLKWYWFICDGQFTIYSKNQLLFNKLSDEFHCTRYSVYFGSPETGRKTVIELNRLNQTLYFAKKVLNETAKQLLKIETENLIELAGYQLQYFKIPRCAKASPTLAIVENIRTNASEIQTNLLPVHLFALKELYSNTLETKSIGESRFWNEICEKLAAIDPYHITKQWIDIYNALYEMKSAIHIHTQIPLSMAHCDFTPFNMYITKEKVYLFDWESARHEIPLLYDAFYFIFITESKVKNTPHNIIKEEITRLKNNSLIKELISLYNIDYQLHYKLFLLYSITQTLYAWQNNVMISSEFSELLMENWLKALNDALGVKPAISNRQTFLVHFFGEPFLREYVLLNLITESVYKMNDLFEPEILIRKKNFQCVIAFIKKYSRYRKILIEKKFNKNIVEIFFTDGSYLRLIFIFQFYTRGTQIIDHEWVLKNTERTAENIMVATPEDKFEYIFLSAVLRKKSIHPLWAAYFENLSLDIKADIAYNIIKKYDLNINSLEPLYHFNEIIYRQIISVLIRSGQKALDVKFRFYYFFYKLKKKYPNSGFLITFSGVESSGKTTVIKMLKELIEFKYHRKVIIINNGPSLVLGKNKLIQTINEPNLVSITKQKELKSVFNLFTLICNYLTGQFVVWYKYTLKGYIVIYDRYFFDYVADPRLYANVNPLFIRRLYKLICKPRLNVFVYAPVTELAKREKLTDENLIENLTGNYITYFHYLSKKYPASRYFSIENIYLDTVIDQIERELGKVM